MPHSPAGGLLLDLMHYARCLYSRGLISLATHVLLTGFLVCHLVKTGPLHFCNSLLSLLSIQYLFHLTCNYIQQTINLYYFSLFLECYMEFLNGRYKMIQLQFCIGSICGKYKFDAGVSHFTALEFFKCFIQC
jgi:hypothetical protein